MLCFYVKSCVVFVCGSSVVFVCGTAVVLISNGALLPPQRLTRVWRDDKSVEKIVSVLLMVTRLGKLKRHYYENDVMEIHA